MKAEKTNFYKCIFLILISILSICLFINNLSYNITAHATGSTGTAYFVFDADTYAMSIVTATIGESLEGSVDDPDSVITDDYCTFFLGWAYADDYCADSTNCDYYSASEIIFESDMSFYFAIYETVENSFTITLNYQNGESVIDVKNLKYNDKYILPTDASKESTAQYSYTFDGWYTESDSDTILNGSIDVVGDETYYASYTETLKTYAVKWYDDEGELLKEETYFYGALPSFNETVLKESTDEYNYEFAGWDSDIVEVRTEQSYYAIFKAIEKTVIDESLPTNTADTDNNNIISWQIVLIAILILSGIALLVCTKIRNKK